MRVDGGGRAAAAPAAAAATGISYLGWAWDAAAPGGWSCTGGPSLIADYRGTPTAFGVGFRDHLQALGGPARAARPLLR